MVRLRHIHRRNRSVKLMIFLLVIISFALLYSTCLETLHHASSPLQFIRQPSSVYKPVFDTEAKLYRTRSDSERHIYLEHSPVRDPTSKQHEYSTSQKHNSISPRDSISELRTTHQEGLVQDDSEMHDTTSDTHPASNVDHAPYLVHVNDDEVLVSRGKLPNSNSRQGEIDSSNAAPRSKSDPVAIKYDATVVNNVSNTEVDHLQRPIEISKGMMAWSADYTFPARSECEHVKERADTLPDMLFMPFEQSVEDVTLQGWEDDWVAKAEYTGPKLQEPKIDFVYNWVNGSQPELKDTMHPYELNSSLNDPEGVWVASHGTNRYREWDELRFSMRSVEKYAGSFVNRIQILVNAFQETSQNKKQKMDKQRPSWLNKSQKVQVLSQEEFFGPEERKCLPSFDSLTIENQLYNTRSETDRLFALSDDMILGKPHAASDLYSPLFGPTMGFKDNAYNTLKPPTQADAERFGEKPFLIYTSWLLNRRFGARKRKGQVHFGHSLSRSIAKEAITSFPRPALRSAYQRFRGETGFQLYSWYVMFHYTMERHREALLWSYIMLRSDSDDDGYLNWSERKKILREVAEGLGHDLPEQYRNRMFYRTGESLQKAGLEAPKVNTEVLWTAMDGPIMIKGLDCDAFDTEDCLAPGFSMPASDTAARNPVFSSAAIFDRVARETPRCGDCLIKLLLNRRRAGLGPLLPHAIKKPQQRATVVKALMKYQYTIVQPDAAFYMVTDAEQVDHALFKPYIKHGKKVGQMCLNDDVVTDDEVELEKLRKAMSALFNGLLPEPSSFEK
ncbi:unnamed protein product [Periconia digitata]|uniref:Uncharacterized protein n=1 Tax=Periconia digitata TaxID=1303443 RepID=A0A9W4US54_9PLEO|nr:unnamed protein product [Periconia digitata]